MGITFKRMRCNEKERVGDRADEAGVEVEEHEYEGMPHGFGYTHEEWMVSFDSWMSKIMANN